MYVIRPDDEMTIRQTAEITFQESALDEYDDTAPLISAGSTTNGEGAQ